MKTLRIIILGLVSVLLVILIVIGGAIIMSAVNKEEPQEPQSQMVEETLVSTPFGAITVLRDASEEGEPDISSDGHFVLKLGSYKFELGFNAGKDDESQAPEKHEENFFERLSTRVKNACDALFDTKT